jgi:hypothetical protein
MDNGFDLAEAALPYQVRHDIWDPSEVEDQLEQRGLYEPDAVYLMSVPENEQEAHFAQVAELLDDIETPNTLYVNRASHELFEEVLEGFDVRDEVIIHYPEAGSRKGDFEHLNDYFDDEDTFLAIGQDYSVPRNHRLASEHLDEWEGPENGFAFESESPNERGSSMSDYLIDRVNTRSWLKEMKNHQGALNLKDGRHFVVGTTYSEDFEDYGPKFGIGKQSELVRSVLPQKFKDAIKRTPAVDNSEI